jgi:hypothetical protein
MKMRQIAAALALLCFTGCATQFQEKHYFKAVDPDTGKAVNYFRITISGHSSFTASRYVSGFYSQKAVEYFFNEFRSDKQPELRLEPVGVDSSDHRVGEEEGAFVLVLSTNAKAVADTIGEMTDNDALTKAFNRLLRKDDIEAAEKLVFGMSARKDDAQRNYENIDHAVFDLKEQMPNADKARLRQQAVRIVAAVAKAMGEKDPIATFDDAKNWVKRVSTQQEKKP